MTLQELQVDIKALKTRAYSLKTKKAKQKAWDKVRETERLALNILYAQLKTFGTHSVKATVKHFRIQDDNFMIHMA